jgi:hypothetical protein
MQLLKIETTAHGCVGVVHKINKLVINMIYLIFKKCHMEVVIFLKMPCDIGHYKLVSSCTIVA